MRCTSPPVTDAPEQAPVDGHAELFDALPHGVAVLDRGGEVVAVNHRWAAERGDHVVRCQVGDTLAAHLADAPPAQAAIAEHIADGLARVLDRRLPSFELQYELGDDEATRWYLVSAAPAAGGGAVVTHTDTTIHHTVQDVLTELAFHDPLTGLPNRSLVIDRIRMALIRAARMPVFPAVLFIDLDGFKAVNDVHGHEVGDAVLVETSRRLTRSVREGDTCGRWGGDEFVIVVELADPLAADGLIERARRAFADPIEAAGATVTVGLSIGVVVSRGADRVDQLIRRADAAMYQAKRSGSGVTVVGPDDP